MRLSTVVSVTVDAPGPSPIFVVADFIGVAVSWANGAAAKGHEEASVTISINDAGNLTLAATYPAADPGVPGLIAVAVQQVVCEGTFACTVHASDVVRSDSVSVRRLQDDGGEYSFTFERSRVIAESDAARYSFEAFSSALDAALLAQALPTTTASIASSALTSLGVTVVVQQPSNDPGADLAVATDDPILDALSNSSALLLELALVVPDFPTTSVQVSTPVRRQIVPPSPPPSLVDSNGGNEPLGSNNFSDGNQAALIIGGVSGGLLIVCLLVILAGALRARAKAKRGTSNTDFSSVVVDSGPSTTITSQPSSHAGGNARPEAASNGADTGTDAAGLSSVHSLMARAESSTSHVPPPPPLVPTSPAPKHDDEYNVGVETAPVTVDMRDADEEEQALSMIQALSVQRSLSFERSKRAPAPQVASSLATSQAEAPTLVMDSSEKSAVPQASTSLLSTPPHRAPQCSAQASSTVTPSVLSPEISSDEIGEDKQASAISSAIRGFLASPEKVASPGPVDERVSGDQSVQQGSDSPSLSLVQQKMKRVAAKAREAREASATAREMRQGIMASTASPVSPPDALARLTSGSPGGRTAVDNALVQELVRRAQQEAKARLQDQTNENPHHSPEDRLVTESEAADERQLRI